MEAVESSNYYFWYFLFAVEIILVFVILFIGYALLQRRKKLLLEEKAIHFNSNNNYSLQELVDDAKQQKMNTPLDVVVGDGSHVIKNGLKISTPVRLFGKGASKTKIEVNGLGPALLVEKVKGCSVANMTIQGSIHCNQSELLIENCQIIANDDGICIEAINGSTITVSGLVRGEGGIAIRAQGESKVILKQPYSVSDDDYVVMDPKSKVEIEKKTESKSNDSNN